MLAIIFFIEIIDNGHGMDEKTIDSIFNPFLQQKMPERALVLVYRSAVGLLSNIAELFLPVPFWVKKQHS
tara:strand:+ start:317 stop:526 length:210 start_codon:yes stop_codon:yes gene_type:complete